MDSHASNETDIEFPDNLNECSRDELITILERTRGQLQRLQSQQQQTVFEYDTRLAVQLEQHHIQMQDLNEKYISALMQLKVHKRKQHENESETIPKIPRVTSPTSRTSKMNNVHIDQPQQVIIGDVHYNNDPPLHQEMVPAKVAEFKTTLIEMAREIAGEIQLPIELHTAIKAVSLQISKEVKKSPSIFEDSGHYIRRDDLKKMFACPKGNIQIEEIFKCALENATKECEKFCTTNDAKKRFVAKHGNNVLVIGQAGIGKTTLTKIVAQLAVDKNILPETEFVLYVRLREVNFEQNLHVIQLISTKGALDKTDLSVEEVLALVKDSPNVLVIFDGVDEVKVDDLKEPSSACSHDAITKPSVLIRNLMSGDLLPNAKILWTCRPRQAFELHESHRPHTILQILGLDRDAQENLGRQICQENWPQVKKHLLSHPDIFSACYVPATCIIAMASLHLGIQDSSAISLQTITQVLVYALATYCRSDHMRGKVNDLKGLTKLAWSGFVDRIAVFSESHVLEACLSIEGFQAFLVTYIDPTASLKFQLLEGDKRSSFSHLIWQEVLSAVHYMFFLSFDEFQKHVSQFTSSRWEVVSKFMFGLCNNQTKSQIQRLLPATVATSDLWSQKKQAIQEFADQLSISISTFDAPEQCPKLLQVSTWLNEANDSEMTNAIMHNLSANLHLSGTFFPTDATSIAFLLASGNKDWKVNINNIQFVADSCVILFQSIELNKCKTPMLYLGFNDMDVEMVALIAKCLRGTEKLWMVNCSLTGACIQALQLGIKQLKEQMEFLYLNNNPFGDSGATHLAGCLGHLKVLNLNNCSITSIGVESLAFALQRLGHKLHILNLRNNSICDAGVSALGTCIFNLDVLDINNCKISGTGAGELAGALTALTQPMELINIGNNAIGDQGAYAFSKCLEKVSELWMKDCGVTETGLKQMQKMHSQLLKNTRVYLGQIPGMGQTYIDLL